MCTYIQVKSLFFSQELFAVGIQRILMKIYPLFIQFILYIYSFFILFLMFQTLLLNLWLALREGDENGDPKHLRDMEALGNICAIFQQAS